jgi:hypothetical protein
MEDTESAIELSKVLKRRGRGPGVKEPLVHASVRFPKQVVEFFDNYYPDNKQEKMREVLIDYVHRELNK